ncbi:MAG TPA: hypothetical protein VKR24_05000 [Candidatus Limnocylindrales bacterium]|nr:hypothetical protein [Candidatus Limnocylindrales bacterium]
MATISRPFTNATRTRRVAGSVAALLFAVGGLLPLSAGITEAHDLAVSFACNDADPSVPVLTINLGEFDDAYVNSVSASIDGTTVLPTTTFPTNFSATFPGGSPSASHTAEVIVLASDDPTGAQGFSKTFELSVERCDGVTPTPPSTAPSTPPSASPTGSVLAATGRPRPTVPATSTVDQPPTNGSSSSLGFLLILFAVVALVIGFAPISSRRQPSRAETRRRR